MSEKAEKGFEARWDRLGIDATLAVTPEATIASRSVLSPGQAALDATVAASLGPSASASAMSDSDSHTLPRISITGPGAAERAQSGSLPDLTLGSLLGEGGMGRVHVATQRSLNREVAVKTLKETATSHSRRALVSEAKITGFLAHPGIIPVHSLGLDDNDQPLLVMKRIDGVPWRDLIHDANNPAWAHWEKRVGDRLLVHLEILSQICDAVHFAHSEGIIHRDIKPENVMLGNYGEVYLVDWGLAVGVSEEPRSELVGTPAYMAPEMAMGDLVGPRTDVYLLGATLHEVLTSEYRHHGNTIRSLLKSACESKAVVYPDSVPAGLALLANRATSRLAENRCESAEAFRQGIASYLSHRNSIELSDASQVRLDQTRKLLAQGELGEQQLAFELSTRAAEARFGFERALDAWPENRAAQGGLQGCRELMVEAHLLRRDAVAGQAELDAMSAAPEELGDRLATLSLALADEREDRKRRELLEQDLDEGVALKERVRSYLMICAGVIGVSLVMTLSGRAQVVTNAESALVATFFLAAAVVCFVLQRKVLMLNTFNRRATAVVFIILVLMLANRLASWAALLPMRQVFLTDLFIITTAATSAASQLIRWIFAAVPVLVIGIVLMVVLDVSTAVYVFSGTTSLAVLTGLYSWYRSETKPSRPDSAK